MIAAEIKDVLQALTLAANLWMFFFLRRLERQKASDDRLKALEKTIAEHSGTVNERLTELETRAESAPSHDDIARIHARIDDMAATLHELSGQFAVANRTLGLIQEHLLRDK